MTDQPAEPTPENDSADPSSGNESTTEAEPNTITDDQLPDDVRPGKDNPLASDPEDTDKDSEGDRTAEATAEGMPDMGEPGSA